MIFSSPTRSTRQRGFTLAELMISVAIVGILSAIAIPNYKSYVVKSNRSAIQTHMVDWAGIQAQYLADSRTYATAAQLETLVPTPAPLASKYTMTVTPLDTPPRFTITATPVPGSPQAGDVVLTIDQAGKKMPGTAW